MTLEERVTTATQPSAADVAWRFWFTLPIYPYQRRRTLRREVVAGELWVFEQVQGIFYVVVPIRMTVVKLAAGGLLVYAPVAPTGECLQLVNELVTTHGDVRYIILPTISGLEHKVFVGPFARAFPQAQVWVAPDQWSFPVNLPLSWLGFPRGRTHVLPPDSSGTPFGDEFDYAILETIDLGPGQFAEVAMFHRRSRTLLLTDSIVAIPSQPPEIVQLEPDPLLFHARDRASEIIPDTPANRQRGWQRICLFALYFQPSILKIRKWSDTWRESFTAPLRSRQTYFGIYPFEWQADWQQGFVNLQADGRLLVAPILETLILNRAPRQTIAWVDRVAQWDFERIIPCHFDAPISTTPEDFRSAFDFLKSGDAADSPRSAVDAALVREIDRQLVKWRIIFPPRDRI
ncbi:DUF4336 domain-containing protein [Chamaesiphon sp. OTE_8_metabat_110]|uniref:DUF4336 domain-containing protein n=1 Tax=Chamaesiphon sp. OTE_8_metabat_110 TaxID=2964696 RepID=UPI00286B1AD6|nr:DUF4336 domain-containing protein [Chamaesiphon sp. OTE_8_metabat_110]